MIVLRLDYIFAAQHARTFLEQLKHLGMDIERVMLVVNRYGEQKQLTIPQAEEALGRKIAHRIPNDPSRINTSNNSGKPIVLQRPRATIARRMASLAESVNGHFPEPRPTALAGGQAKAGKLEVEFLGMISSPDKAPLIRSRSTAPVGVWIGSTASSSWGCTAG